MGGHQDSCTCPNCGNKDAITYVDTTFCEIISWCDKCGWIKQQTGFYEGRGRETPKLISTIEKVGKEFLQRELNKNFIAFDANNPKIKWEKKRCNHA